MSTGKGGLPATRPGASYDVGFGKPPQKTQFALGKAGNPRGRPKGAKNKHPALDEERLKDIVMAEAYRDISVRDGTRNVSMPMAHRYPRPGRECCQRPALCPAPLYRNALDNGTPE